MRNKKILILSLSLLPLLSNCTVDKRFLEVIFDCNGGYIETSKDVVATIFSSRAYEGWTWEEFVTRQDIKTPISSYKFSGWFLNGAPVTKDYVITCSILVVANWIAQ